jgi:hypothetical protein
MMSSSSSYHVCVDLTTPLGMYLVCQSPHSDQLQKKDEEAAIMESKISQIRDLFPDYGKGFLAACLEAYNLNPEEVIQRILEGTKERAYWWRHLRS